MNELKPCPFCGAQPSIFPRDPENEGNAWASVQCCNDDCPIEVISYEYGEGHSDSVAKAAAAWNRRAQAEPKAGEARDATITDTQRLDALTRPEVVASLDFAVYADRVRWDFIVPAGPCSINASPREAIDKAIEHAAMARASAAGGSDA